MLRIVSLTLQGLLAALLVYELAVAAWGWPRPRRAVASAARQRFRVVIPAHNEAAVITGVLTDLRAQDYPRELVTVAVVADRCSDDTAAVAAPLAVVAERSGGPEGKGAALDWYLANSPLDGEALVVLDADNRVPSYLLSRFNDELAAGSEVLQAYLDVVNPDGSPLATASALTYWAGNRMVQQARHRLGWSADLGGTGMCFATSANRALGSFGSGLTEDQDALARLVIAGFRVRWLHDVRIHDEKPQGVGDAVRQRARWVAGKRRVASRNLGGLLRAAGRQRSWAPLDVALRLLHPGRSFLALVATVLAVAAAFSGSAALFPWQLWALLAVTTVLAPILFLRRDRVPLRYVARYPLVVLIAMLWLPIRIASRFTRRWRRTPRRAEVG
jgi:cellulose synthase/poly-beta-1,6-N-acetylglucosamine synthase-like glycosyltransferase